MRVIGVVDVRDGRAVRARAGQRDRYQPIGDAVDLARRYVEHYTLTELYVADLDAIDLRWVGRPPSGKSPIGVPLWLDAGVSRSTAPGSARSRRQRTSSSDWKHCSRLTRSMRFAPASAATAWRSA